jgi:HEAT repeat protein
MGVSLSSIGFAVALLACVARPTVHEGKTRAEWVALLKSPDQKTRVDAASTLGWYFGPDAAPEILPLLADQQAGTRSAAAFALGFCGDASPEIIAGLETLLTDRDEIVRIDAALAISQLECPKGCAARMLPHLIEGLPNPDRTVIIASWLRKLGPAAAPAVPALVQALSSQDVDTRLNAPLTLACVGKAAESALPRLREIQATDPEAGVRDNVEKAIAAIMAAPPGGKAEEAWWCR